MTVGKKSFIMTVRSDSDEVNEALSFFSGSHLFGFHRRMSAELRGKIIERGLDGEL